MSTIREQYVQAFLTREAMRSRDVVADMTEKRKATCPECGGSGFVCTGYADDGYPEGGYCEACGDGKGGAQ